MKKVVVITSRFPVPLDKGDKLRIYNHIKEISSIAEVYLFCLIEEQPKIEDWEKIQIFCKKIYTYRLSRNSSIKNALIYFAKGGPLQIGYFFDTRICKRMLSDIVFLGPDHIHCHMIRMTPYVRGIKGCSKSLDYMDSMVLNDMAGQHLTSFPLSIVRNSERVRIKRFERKVQDDFDHHFIISDRDRTYLDQEIQDHVRILPNGVEYFELSSNYAHGQYDICFCGNLGYPPNIEAVEYLIHQILPELPHLNCVIAGADVSDKLRKLKKENIEIISPVKDMSEVYLNAKLQVTPIFNGSGQQNKILEAMAYGVVNITTSFVNQSIGADPDSEILICHSPDQFKTTIAKILADRSKLETIATKANNFVKRNFNWSINSQSLLSVIESEIK